MIVIALVAGALGIVLSLALRRDTSRVRQIINGGGIVDQRFAYVLVPGFSLLLLGMGGLGVVLPGVGGALGYFLGPLLAALCGIVALGGAVLSVFGLGSGPAPDWALPRWARGAGEGKKR